MSPTRMSPTEAGWFFHWSGRAHYDPGTGRSVCREAKARDGLFGDQPIVGDLETWKSKDDCGACRREVDALRAATDQQRKDAAAVPLAPTDGDGWTGAGDDS